MTRTSKQQIAAVKSALREIDAELLGWGPHVLVLFNGEAQKAQIVACMSQLGWHYVNDPSNETGDVSMVEFSLDDISSATATSVAQQRTGKGRRVKFPAPFFASLGILSALVGIVVAVAAFYTDYRMNFLERVGAQTAGEIERTYFTSGRGGPTYYVSYRFVDAQGITHKGDDAYPFQDWISLHPGASISVTYLPDDPQRNNLTQRVRLITSRSLREEMTLIGVPWIIAGCFFIGYWARRRPA